MINELYELSKVLHNEDIKTQSWHRKYQPIPNIRSNAPCVCIKVSAGKVIGISSVDAELGKILRKYGSNQGSYPCMNLAPLYRITDDTKKKKIADLGNHPEKIDDACIAEMRRKIPITPELSTRSMHDEIIRDDSCIKTIKQLMEQENAMQFRTVDREFEVIDADTIPAVVNLSLAEEIAHGRSDWKTLQRQSVSIRRDKIKRWNLKEIAPGVYRWTLGYNDFLGYMSGVINTGKAIFC